MHGIRPNKNFSNFSFSDKEGNSSEEICFPEGKTSLFDNTGGDGDRSLCFTVVKLPWKLIFADGLINKNVKYTKNLM